MRESGVGGVFGIGLGRRPMGGPLLQRALRVRLTGLSWVWVNETNSRSIWIRRKVSRTFGGWFAILSNHPVTEAES